MNFHRGMYSQQGSGLGSIFSGLFRTLVPVARNAVGKIVKNQGVRAAGKYLKNQATQAAVDTALEALQGKQVGVAAKRRLKTATQNILQAARRKGTPPARKRTTKRRNVRVLAARNYGGNGRGKRRRVEQEPLFDDDEYDDY